MSDKHRLIEMIDFIRRLERAKIQPELEALQAEVKALRREIACIRTCPNPGSDDTQPLATPKIASLC